jgi:hypothetical protein
MMMRGIYARLSTTTTFDVSIQSGYHQTHSSIEADRSERLTAAGYSYVEINQRVIIGEREGRPGSGESIGGWGLGSGERGWSERASGGTEERGGGSTTYLTFNKI